MWLQRKMLKPDYVRLTTAQRKARAKETARPPEEKLRELTHDIEDIEVQIRQRTAEFEKVRLDMMTGILTHEGVSAKQVTDQLIKQLDSLRTRHREALATIDRAALDRAGGGVPGGLLGADSRCSGGCQKENLRSDDILCLEVCTLCGTTYDKRLDNTSGNATFGDYHPGESLSRIGGGYKPPNHFAEIVSQFQGKRRSAAPQEIVDKIGRMCDRYKFPKFKRTPDVSRMFLKQLQHEQATKRKFARQTVAEKAKKFTDYYKHCPEISYRLSGIPPPYMMPMQEQRVFSLFPKIVAGYKSSQRYLSRKNNRKNRKKRDEPNNMNYLYVFYKECQLLGYEEFLPYIPLPKSFANIDDNDENGWHHCCRLYNWQYTPTR